MPPALDEVLRAWIKDAVREAAAETLAFVKNGSGIGANRPRLLNVDSILKAVPQPSRDDV